jgi:hypothetical protein
MLDGIRMIFSSPCCDDLKAALAAGEDRALRLLHGESSPLVLISHSVWGEAAGKPAKARVMAPVYFCPFCGSHLQTREGVKALAEKGVKALAERRKDTK